jgi:hypothetical protein
MALGTDGFYSSPAHNADRWTSSAHHYIRQVYRVSRFDCGFCPLRSGLSFARLDSSYADRGRRRIGRRPRIITGARGGGFFWLSHCNNDPEESGASVTGRRAKESARAAREVAAFRAIGRAPRDVDPDQSIREPLLTVHARSHPHFQGLRAHKMRIRQVIEARFKAALVEAGKPVPPTFDDNLVLLHTGLDSLGFAILVTQLEQELSYDPFTLMEQAVYPTTFGEFVSIYERFAPA